MQNRSSTHTKPVTLSWDGAAGPWQARLRSFISLCTGLLVRCSRRRGPAQSRSGLCGGALGLAAAATAFRAALLCFPLECV